MAEAQNPALKTVLDYFEAFSARDADKAASYIAEDFVAEQPDQRIEGLAGFRAAMEGFFQIMQGAELDKAVADGNSVALFYRVHTVPVADGAAASLLEVRDSKIVSQRLFFDRLPYEQAARARTAA